ncbi:hypothetical protein D9M72_328760 [compost metagenome]
MGAELLGLHERAAREFLSRDAGGEAQVILDARTRARLAARCAAVEHSDRQPVRCRIDGRRKPGRAGADDRHVIDMHGIEFGDQLQAGRELAHVGIAQHGAAWTDDKRKIIGLWREALEKGNRFRVLLGVQRNIGIVVPAQEILQFKESCVAGYADNDGPASTFHGQNAPQDQGAHDLLANIGFLDHQCAQFIGPQQHGLDLFENLRVDDGGLVGKLRDIRSEFPVPRIGVDDLIAIQAVADDDPHLARQDDKYPGAKASRAIEEVAFRVVAQLAKAAHPFHLGIGEDRKHLLETRMVAYGRIFLDVGVAEVCTRFEFWRRRLACLVRVVVHRRSSTV